MIALAKNANQIINEESLIQFFAPWYRVAKYHPTILAYYQSTSSRNNDVIFKIKQKATLKAVQVSKKIKYINDPIANENTRITVLRNQQLIYQGKANIETKIQVKKLVNAEKKEKEKSNKAK